MVGYFSVSIIHQTLIWAAGSLTCVYVRSLCRHVYSHRVPRFVVSSEGVFVESAQNLTQEKSPGTKPCTWQSPIQEVTTLDHAALPVLLTLQLWGGLGGEGCCLGKCTGQGEGLMLRRRSKGVTARGSGAQSVPLWQSLVPRVDWTEGSVKEILFQHNAVLPAAY